MPCLSYCSILMFFPQLLLLFFKNLLLWDYDTNYNQTWYEYFLRYFERNWPGDLWCIEKNASFTKNRTYRSDRSLSPTSPKLLGYQKFWHGGKIVQHDEIYLCSNFFVNLFLFGVLMLLHLMLKIYDATGPIRTELSMNFT